MRMRAQLQILRLTVLSVILLCASPARARDFYVSPSGSDQADGSSPELALRSLVPLEKRHFQAGDRILLRGGARFRGTLTFGPESAGTAKHPVVVKSYGQGRAILVPPAGQDAILILDTEGYRIEDLEIQGGGSSDAPARGNGVHLRSSRTDLKTRQIHLSRMEISGFGGVDLPGAPSGNGVLIDDTSNGGGVSDVQIQGLVCHDNDQAGIRTESGSGNRHKRITIAASHAYHNQGIPALLHHTGSGIVLGGVSQVLVEGSRADSNGERNQADGGPVGIWAWDSDHVRFVNNESFGNRTASHSDGGGFDFDGGVTDSVMVGNYSHDNDGAGFLLCDYAGSDPVARIMIRGNRSRNDGRRNSYSAALISGDIEDATFEENDFTMDRAPEGAPAVAMLWYWTGHNVVFRANRFTATGGALLLSFDTAPGLKFIGNQVGPVGVPLPAEIDGKSYLDFLDWVQGPGKGFWY